MEKKVNIRITANDRQARTVFNRMEKGFAGLQKQVRGLQGMIGFFGGAIGAYAGFEGLKRFLVASVEAAREAEVSQTRLAAVLEATGYAAGITAGEVETLAKKYARLTVLSDEQVRDAAGTLLTFRNINRDVFEEALSLSIDLSQTLSKDLQSSILQVGKALNDPVRGMSALSEAGITFNDVQREQIKNFVEQGRQADAMKVILEELRGEFGGAAEAMNTGLNKATNDLAKAWDDLLEAFGKSPALVEGAEKSFGYIAKHMREFADQLERAESNFEVFLRTIGKVTLWGDPLADWLFSREAQQQHGATGSWGLPGDGAGGGTTNPPPIDQKALEQIQKVIDALRFEKEQLARTATEQRVYNELKAAGVSINSKAGQTIAGLVRGIKAEKTALEESAEAAQKAKEEQEAALKLVAETQESLAREGAEMFRLLQTPLERYNEQMDRAAWLTEQGYMSIDTYVRRTDQLAEEYNSATNKMKDSIDGLSEFTIQAYRNMTDYAQDFFFNAMQGNFDDLGSRFKTMLDGMVANWLAAQLMMQAFGPSFGSGGDLGGWIGSVVNWGSSAFSGGGTAATSNMTAGNNLALLPGRAYGGPVFPGREYKILEKGMPEIFTPQTAGRITPIDKIAGGPTVHVTVVANDINSFKSPSSQMQVQAALAKAISRANRRNN